MKKRKDQEAAERFYLFSELKPVWGISYTRQHLKRLEELGTFPGRVRIGGDRVVWVHSELVEWQRRLIAERDAGDQSAIARNL